MFDTRSDATVQLGFYFQLLGGGDAKFYAAVASWFAIGQAWMLGLAIVLCGGVVACFWIGWRMLRNRSLSVRSGESSRSDLPYGVAIAAGALIVLLWDFL
ncbi:MAG: hypothetical protein KGJ57_22750 [Sphingomonadales bacterium]|nr:hypothetical protein [Sphingomonadales bacterium]